MYFLHFITELSNNFDTKKERTHLNTQFSFLSPMNLMDEHFAFREYEISMYFKE